MTLMVSIYPSINQSSENAWVASVARLTKINHLDCRIAACRGRLQTLHSNQPPALPKNDSQCRLCGGRFELVYFRFVVENSNSQTGA
ncbi:MAG: hypothetical protein H7274_27020 [Rhodoferax sp.]|nr:hypothetical protein [Rhodoferax sp.]